MSYILWIFIVFSMLFPLRKKNSGTKEMNVDICTFDGEPKKDRQAKSFFLKTLKIGENNRPSQAGSKWIAFIFRLET